MPRILIVCTSASEMQFRNKDGSMPTGVWCEEAAAPYLQFQTAGHEVVLVSPNGGKIPVDAGSLKDGFYTDAAKKCNEELKIFETSVALKDVLAEVKSNPQAYKALYLAGGHGTVVDFVQNATLTSLVETMYNNGCIVSAVCHGVCGLLDCKDSSGKLLIAGKECTCFSDTEETAVGLTEKVPYSLEQRLVSDGALYLKADDWNSKVAVAGKLVTGQNPQSSAAVADAVLAQL